MSRKITYAILLFIVCSSWGDAQGGAIDEETYQRLAKEIDYSKTTKVWRPKRFGKPRAPRISQTEKTPTNSADGLEGIFSILGYILIALVVIGVVFMGLKDFRSENIGTSKVVDLDAIEDLESIDLDELLQNAVANGDFRLAVRLKFLIILKRLTQTEKIKWKPYKTNRVYVRELKNTPLQENFRRIADVFEYVWYGISAVDETAYELYRSDFDTFLKSISDE